MSADDSLSKGSDNELSSSRWLQRFAGVTAFCTLILIGVGGLVTSHGAGMAVPDWPTSYGYNMFLLPFSYWVGGVLYEHSHRLVASFVGFLTTILAIWIWLGEKRRWLRWLGVAAWFAVVLQGVLGGLRVTLFKAELGVFHGTIAQVFFVLTLFLALALSRWWCEGRSFGPVPRSLRVWAIAATGLILAQLVIGAMMRHRHAGLAIPDFPLAYGELWPRTDGEFIGWVNQNRIDSREFEPITAFDIRLQMIHRVGAVLIFCAVGWLFRMSWKARERTGLWTWAGGWFGLILVQVGLGMSTVLSNKAADIATLHVWVGAGSLGFGALWVIAAYRSSYLEAKGCGTGKPVTRSPGCEMTARRSE